MPDQPDNGFTVRVRLPEGNSVTRRFLPDMDVDVCISLGVNCIDIQMLINILYVPQDELVMLNDLGTIYCVKNMLPDPSSLVPHQVIKLIIGYSPNIMDSRIQFGKIHRLSLVTGRI